MATSDKRIKNVIGLSNSTKDLEILNNIEITDYTYIDEVQNGSKEQKKVIAQQLQSVLPNAITQTEGIIPSVYQSAKKVSVEDGNTLIETEKAHGFASGDQVKLVLIESGELLVEVTVLNENTFLVPQAIEEDVFVYGKKVNDLLTVDYDGLTTLNISATQELTKIIQKQRAEIEHQQSEIEELKALVGQIQNTLGGNGTLVVSSDH